jgi:hypothetical protein
MDEIVALETEAGRITLAVGLTLVGVARQAAAADRGVTRRQLTIQLVDRHAEN